MKILKMIPHLRIVICLIFTLSCATGAVAEITPDAALQQLQTLNSTIENGQLEEANNAQAAINQNDLSDDSKVRFILLSTKLALLQHQGEKALTQLARIQGTENLPPRQAIPYHQLAAHAYLAMNKPLASVRERIQLQALLTKPAARQQNAEKLWQILTHMGRITPDLIEGESIEVADWLQLANLAMMSDDDPTQKEALAQWRANHPNHPGLIFLTKSISAAPSNNNVPQVAMLLPLTGTYAEAGKAVQTGFMTAMEDAQQPIPALSVRTYDTNQSRNVVSLYEKAIREGAQFIIGPMQKNNVIQLAKRGHFEVPTLALNYVPIAPQTNFYQFGLSPQDEAEQVARRATADGKQSALIVAPKDAWGQGVVDSFVAEWQTIGGRVVGTARYEKSDDLDVQIRQLLQVERTVKHKDSNDKEVDLESRRRQDADMVFVVGNPAVARQIRPLLKFYYAGSLPVYSSSMIYSGIANTVNDRDLDGVRFCDMPWIVQSTQFQSKLNLLNNRGAHQGVNARLYAIGIDSYALLKQLQRPEAFPADGLFGTSGRLQLNASQQISRQLVFAVFRNGTPVVL